MTVLLFDYENTINFDGHILHVSTKGVTYLTYNAIKNNDNIKMYTTKKM